MNFKQLYVNIGLVAASVLAFSPIPAQAFSLTDGTNAANSAKSIKLFILAGQSNMVGYRSNIRDLPEQLKQPEDNVLWYDAHQKWETLQAPTEPFPFSGGVANGVGFGPEISLGLDISKGLHQPVAFVKYAVDSTNLAENWNPNGSLYQNMLNRVNDSIIGLSSVGYTADIAGFFWMQGESDAKNDINMALKYGPNFINFINRVRTDFHQPDLPFVYGLIPVRNNQHTTEFGTFKYGDIVRAAQIDVDNIVPFVGAVETIDLPRSYDNLHLNSQGLIGLGDRLGDKWLSLRPVPESSTLGFIGFAILIFPFSKKGAGKPRV